MKTVGLDKDIELGDEVRFIIETRDGSDCVSDPYQITEVRLYFINREFTDPTASEYNVEFSNPELASEFERIKKAVCIKSKPSVKAATTSDISLSGLQNIDGINLSQGDRILVKDQSNPAENGIYVVSQEDWERSQDASSGVIPGMYVFVDSGVSNMGTGWVLEAAAPVSLGTTLLKFILFAQGWQPLSPDPDGEENIMRLEELRLQVDATKTSSPFFYKDATVIKKFGGETDSAGEFFPAWLNPDNVALELKSKVMSDNILQRVEDVNGAVPGKFALEWNTNGLREGDYFICWTWRPTMGDATLSAHQFFYISGNDKATSSIPTHRVRQDKYELLLERYTPEMFKTRISNSDLSPEVISEFNKSVAKGFMFVENQASSVIDLLDANSIHEQLLPLLSNMFNLKVKSGDSALWRRQIKNAVPNFKKKGSVAGLRSAMGDAGMKLLRLSRLWQVTPKYTHQEHFTYSGSEAFTLSRPALIDCNLKIWRRNANEAGWTELGSGCEVSSSSSGHWSSSFVEISGSSLIWVGAQLNTGDSIMILYAFRSVPPGEQANEDYIRLLPLMDDRDERDQEYPPKNWNVHLIEEDDENFGVLIPVRHPLSDPIVWGRVRTEFPYSENLYNMEEYNGSRRDSNDPCDIDRSFMDACGQCASSKFNLDVEVENLSDDSFKEVRQIVEEYMPFHALPNSFNLWGANNEFIRSSEESIRAMVLFSREDTTIAGEAQHIFSRDVYQSEVDLVRRDVLASMDSLESPTSGTNEWSGTIRNSRTILLSSVAITEEEVFWGSFSGRSPGFDSLNVDVGVVDPDPFESSNLLEILGVSANNYSISSLDRSIAVVNGSVDSSLVGPVFEYRISNKIADLNVNITQYEEIVFGDEDADFSMTGIVTQHDVDSGLSTSAAWHLLFESKEYLVRNILPDGTLLLDEIGPTSAISGWKLMNGSAVEKEGLGGLKSVTGYGLVGLNSPGGLDVRKTFKIGDFVYLGWGSNLRIYELRSFQKESNKFYIRDYDEGDIGFEDAKVYRRVMDKKIGQLGYDRLVIVAEDDLESVLRGPDGTQDNLLENHMLFVDGEYYTISDVDGNTASLSGPQGSYDTSGISVNFSIYRFSKERLTLSEKQEKPYESELTEHEFNWVDRSGGVIISGNEGMSGNLLSSLLNSSEPMDVMSHNERIEFKIEYKEENK